MAIIPRPYQQQGIDIAVDFFNDGTKDHGLEIFPTGSGKSVVIANIAKQLCEPTIVFQPSIEILNQNFKKFMSYGYRAGIYSASAGLKHLEPVTFATIGSVVKKMHLFKSYKNYIFDECHLISSEGGMYHDFIHNFDDVKCLGVTATPYRLAAGADGSMLKFITKTKPAIFKRLLYYVQNDVLFNSGNLAELKYFKFNVVDRAKLEMNANGSDFNQSALRNYYRDIDMVKHTVYYANRILAQRKNLLVFCSLNAEAAEVADQIPGAVCLTGETETNLRSKILKDFIGGKIRCVVNCMVLDTGFDFDRLEAVLLAKSTMSMAKYYQMIGRVMRPYTYPDGTKKVGWVADLGDNIRMFGKIETMQIRVDQSGSPCIWNTFNGIERRLTDVNFRKS